MRDHHCVHQAIHAAENAAEQAPMIIITPCVFGRSDYGMDIFVYGKNNASLKTTGAASPYGSCNHRSARYLRTI